LLRRRFEGGREDGREGGREGGGSACACACAKFDGARVCVKESRNIFVWVKEERGRNTWK